MPCYDHRDSSSYIHEHEVKPLQDRCDQYARWLCWLLADRRQAHDAFAMPVDLARWEKEHRDFDQQRQGRHEDTNHRS